MVKFDCPGCGGPLQLRAPGASLSMVCSQCGALLDVKDPRHKLLGDYSDSLSVIKAAMKIPLGKRGTFDGAPFEVIGALTRRVIYYGVGYDWTEYLLYNPYKGFRWLVESQGHWLLMETIPQVPKERRL